MKRFLQSRVCIVALAVAAASGCSSGEFGMTGPNPGAQDAWHLADALVPGDTVAPGPAPVDVAITRAPIAASKPDPDFLVPAHVASRRSPTARGTRVAWVEERGDGAPHLVTWDVADEADAPTALRIPNLQAPHSLQLTDDFLVFVDDRYGDADIFAVALGDGAERPVDAGLGAALEPAAGPANVVAWSACRGCVSGDEANGWEILRRDLDGPQGAEQLTDDDVSDRAPSFGTVARGGRDVLLAWIRGGRTLRVIGQLPGGAPLDAAHTLSRPAEAVAVAEGRLAWRPRPMIINPDSMRPSEIRLTDARTGATHVAATRAAVPADASRGLVAAGSHVGWLAAADSEDEVVATLLDVGRDSAERVVAQRLTEVALSRDVVVLIAPRADNAGRPDVWIQRGIVQ